MGKKAFDEKLAALAALRIAVLQKAAPADVEAGIRKALKDRSNFVVGRAAAIAGESGIAELVPDLLAAYEKHFEDAVARDPQCWAKNAAAVALKTLGHREAATYIRGIQHIQLEPVWGGKADTGATLRSACALALIDCSMPALAILRHLTPLLNDQETPVRIDAVRAVAHLGDPAGTLLLRLKTLMGDGAPEVLGQCFTALLALETAADALPFIERFLRHPETDMQLEAACVLAQSREPEALAAVLRYWEGRLVTQEIRRAILLNLGASPLREAAEFLRQVMETQPDLAEAAREALAVSRFGRGD